MNYKDLQPHPLANIFPMIAPEDRADFRRSIEDHGLQEKIVLLDGLILDGRNRYRELKELGRENDPRNYVHFGALGHAADLEPIDFVMTRNMARRHMNESQRAMSAARAANMRQGERTDLATRGGLDNSPSGPKISAGQAADLFKVSERAVSSANKVIKDGVEGLKFLVDEGRVAVSVAEQLARLPQPQQTEILSTTKPEALKSAAKKAERDRREADLAEKQLALPAKKYGVIYADPEWNFETRSENGMDRAAGNHYRTSPLADLQRRPVGDIAADDCVLFLWATVPMLVEAFCVADAWGFCALDRSKVTGLLAPAKKEARYVSSWDWIKDKIGTGYWGRNKHEVLLIFTRGRPIAPALGTQPPSALDEVPTLCTPGFPDESAIAVLPRAEHSRKPDLFAEWIERLWPAAPKIELNARRARPGWDIWGDEAPEGEKQAIAAPETAREAPKEDLTPEALARSFPPVQSTPEEIKARIEARRKASATPGAPTIERGPFIAAIGGLGMRGNGQIGVSQGQDGRFYPRAQVSVAGQTHHWQDDFEHAGFNDFDRALIAALCWTADALDFIQDVPPEDMAAIRAALAWIGAQAQAWGLDLSRGHVGQGPIKMLITGDAESGETVAPVPDAPAQDDAPPPAVKYDGKHTDATDAIIKFGYKRGWPLEEIAALLGLPKARKGVIKGRAHRLGLTDAARIGAHRKGKAWDERS